MPGDARAIPAPPGGTTTYPEAVAAGFWGERTDDWPDERYMVTGGATKQIPQLTSCTPSSGPPAGATVLNLGGTHLGDVEEVRVKGALATAVTVVDDTHATATTPAGTTGPATIEARSLAGASQLAGAFSYA